MAYQLVEAPASFAAPEDREVFLRAREALWNYEPLRVTRPALALSVEQGVVRVAGRVRTRALKLIVGYLLRTVEGVREVRNELLADPDLAGGVAEALAADPALAPLCLRVEARYGVVALAGVVPSVQVEQRALEVARAVPGVDEVHSELVIQPSAAAPARPELAQWRTPGWDVAP